MPYKAEGISKEHLEALRLWIRAGAPKKGIVEGTPAVSTIHSYHTLPLPSSTQRQMCTTTLSPAEHAEGQRRGKNSGNQENIPSEKLRWSAAKKAIQN